MSLPLNRTLQLRLQAHRVDATLQQGWPRRSSAAQAHAHVHEALPLAEAMDLVITRLLDGLRGQRPRLAVDISDALVYLDVIHGDFARSSPEQLEAMAMASVQDIVANASEHHVVQWQLQSDLHHLLLCAVPRALLGMVERTAQRHRLQLLSVQPEFCSAWNRHSGALCQAEGVFAMLGAACTMAWVNPQGTITAISCNALSEPADQTDAPADLDALSPQLDRQLQRLVPAHGANGRFQRILISSPHTGNDAMAPAAVTPWNAPARPQ